MKILTALYTLLIGPLELFFEVLYSIAYRIIGNPGLSIIFLSLAMNFLVLPLYMRADAMQNEQNEIEKKLQPWVKHIKKTFKGDECFMLLQTYYRQNNYKPTQILRGSVSLFLEIPFFIAAYRFLSDLELLNGVSFGPISNLGAEDGILVIAGITINILPILMTLINIISSKIYCKDAPLKAKIQLYGIALIFLAFLYKSPAGLVFYWTLNNLFSLIKNIFYRLKNPKKILGILSSVAGICIIAVAIIKELPSTKIEIFVIAIGLIMQIPLLQERRKGTSKIARLIPDRKPSKAFFLSACLILSGLSGLLIPSSLINESPTEFIDKLQVVNPTLYIVNAFLLSVGMFVIWFGIFYSLASDKGKVAFEAIVWIADGVAILDYIVLGKDLGTISPELVFDNGLSITTKGIVLNLFAIVCLSIVLYMIWNRASKLVSIVSASAVIAIVALSVINIAGMQGEINKAIDKINSTKSSESILNLSKTGNNVVVIMMDSAISKYIPCIFNEKPELKEKYDGFTYYPNTLAYGAHTNYASPALYGGYEYTPEEINKRGNESLESKQNEALLVMPVLFDENNYDVTVCDPTYAGYEWIPDLSIYDEYEDINAYITMGKIQESGENYTVEDLSRNLFCYGVFQISPEAFRGTLYNTGKYNEANKQDRYTAKGTSSSNTGSSSKDGRENTKITYNEISQEFTDSYNVLKALPSITNTKEVGNNFIMISNETTHNGVTLQKPEYEPSTTIENSDYIYPIGITTGLQQKFYDVNMATIMKLGDWFDYLKNEGVYDNTRIIIVSDHGLALGLDENYTLAGQDLMHFNALLMVKDFNAQGFDIDEQFMTNADVPSIATKGLVNNAKNPSTGKTINSDAKHNKSEQHVCAGHEYYIYTNNGNKFMPADWLSVHDDVRNVSNWKYIGNY